MFRIHHYDCHKADGNRYKRGSQWPIPPSSTSFLPFFITHITLTLHDIFYNTFNNSRMFSTSTALLFTSLAVYASFSNAGPTVQKRGLNPIQVTGTAYDDQIRVYSTGIFRCEGGLYQNAAGGKADTGDLIKWDSGSCVPINTPGFDPRNAIAATSNSHNTAAPHDVSVFFWTNVDNQPRLRQIHWRDDGAGFRIDDAFSFELTGAYTKALTATSWVANKKEYWSVFYYADKTIHEVLWDGSKRLPSASIPVDQDIQNIQSISWVTKGQVFKALYVLANGAISEYFWSPDPWSPSFRSREGRPSYPTLNPTVIRNNVESFSVTILANVPSIRINYKLRDQQDVIEIWEDAITTTGIRWSNSHEGKKATSGNGPRTNPIIFDVHQPDPAGKASGWETTFWLDTATGISETHRGPAGYWSPTRSLPI